MYDELLEINNYRVSLREIVEKAHKAGKIGQIVMILESAYGRVGEAIIETLQKSNGDKVDLGHIRLKFLQTNRDVMEMLQ